MGDLPKITKRGRAYSALVDDANGRRTRLNLGRDKRVAQRLLIRFLDRRARIRAGLEDEDSQQADIGPLTEEYLAAKAREWSASHMRCVRAALPRDLAALRCRRVAQISQAALIRLRDSIAETRSNRTANARAGFILTFLRWCESTGRIPRSPVTRVPKLPTTGSHQTRKRHAFTPLDASRLQAGADEDGSVGDVVAVVIGTGFRLGEALRLRWRNFSGRALRVEQSKNGDARENPVDDRLARRLVELRTSQGLLLRRPPGEDDPILLSRNRRPWSQKGAWTALRRALRRAGLPAAWPDGTTVDWHALRRTYCTWLAITGASLAQAQRLMGHRSSRLVLDVYTDLGMVPIRSAVDGLAALRDGSSEDQEEHRG